MSEINVNRLELENYKPLREVVFEHLRNSILDGSLKPGERLMELQLAEQLGVSRTPIREAIRKLELEGLVEMIARKGAYVADLSIKDILDALEVRMNLEGLAANLASQRMDEEDIGELKDILKEFEDSIGSTDKEKMIELDDLFHSKIVQGSRNSKLIQIVHGLQEQLQRFRVIYFTEYNEHKDLLKYHQAILNAIINKDPEKAEKYAVTHIRMLEKTIVQWKKKNKK